MSKYDYVPTRNGDKSPWATNLKDKIAIHGATIGLAAGDITAVQDAADDIVEGVNEIAAAIATKEAAVNAANTKISLAEKTIRSQVKRAKTHPSYTPAIGQVLGVIGNEVSIDIASAQPVLKLVKDPAGWRITFYLHGFFDGVNIYKMFDSGEEYKFLARDTSSPYIDTGMVKPGTRYRAFFIINDVEVGLASNEVLIEV